MTFIFAIAIFSEELFKIKISKKELLFQSRYFYTASTFSEKLHLGKKLIFQKSNIPHYLLFLESCHFRAAAFSKDATFSEELLFYNILFQKSYYFTVTIPLHSYTCYLFVSN